MSDPIPFDALAAVLAARVRWRTVPQSSYVPPPTSEVPNPAPVVTPAHQVLEFDPDNLPAEVVRAGGAVDLGQMVALLQDAVRRQRQIVLRYVHAQQTFTSGTIPNGGSAEVTLTWETSPAAAVETALPRLESSPAWMGRVVASVKAGSVTSSGCTVVLTSTGAGAVSFSSGAPMTVHADGLYNYLPPYDQ